MKTLTKTLITPGLRLSLLVIGMLLISMAPVSAAYNSSLLMGDDTFTDGSYSQNDIQNFLNSKGSYLAGYQAVEDCGSSGGAHYSYYASYYACGQSVSAAKIISDAARAYSINPRVLIATMQKEQSLITAQNPSASQINCAMGYLSCDSNYLGFFAQVDNGAWQFRTYLELMNGRNWWGYTPDSYPCRNATDLYSTGLYPGRTVTFYNPGGQARTVTLGSSATAALYCYTPHVGPYSETGYSGSYNFVYWYEQWFGQTVSSTGVSIGRDAGVPLTLARNQNGTLQLVGVADNDSIYYKRQGTASTDNWTAWAPLGGALRNVAAETNADGRIEVVGVATNGNIYYNSQPSPNSAGWSGWTQMDGGLSTVTVARNADGCLEVVGVAANGSIYHKRQYEPNSDSWWEWGQFGGALKNVTVGTNADGRIEMVGVASNGNIYYASQLAPNSTSWSGWTQMDGGLSSAALARNANGTLQLTGIAPNGSIYVRRQGTASTDNWTAWAPLGGALRNVAAETNADGRIEVVGVATNGNIYYNSQPSPNSAGWSGWTQMDGALRKY